MASPPTTIKIHLTNVTEFPATLVSSSYEGAPLTIKVDPTSTNFEQNINSNYLLGALVYNIGGYVKWIVLWSNDNMVSTRIINYDAPIVWKEIVDNLQPDSNNAKFDYEHGLYTAQANISGGSKNLNATISFVKTKKN